MLKAGCAFEPGATYYQKTTQDWIPQSLEGHTSLSSGLPLCPILYCFTAPLNLTTLRTKLLTHGAFVIPELSSVYVSGLALATAFYPIFGK